MDRLLISPKELYSQINSRFGSGGGIYRLHCFADQTHQEIIHICRVCGVDKEGVLYIGKAISYLNRVITFKKALSPDYNSRGHICRRRYWNDTYTSFRKKFPYERLCVSFLASENPEELEKAELARYCSAYGEPPPLNRMG